MNTTPDAYRVHAVRSGTSNAYLLTGSTGTILIDTGSSGDITRFGEQLAEAGIRLQDITLLVLTHAHYDHVSLAAEIREHADCRILSHAAAAPFLKQGHTPFPRGTGLLSRGVSSTGTRFFPRKGDFRAFSPDITITGRTFLGEYGVPVTILPTPGHTAGSLSVLTGAGDAFVGDTCFHILPWTVCPPFADDPATLAASWQRLLAEDATTFHPGHGSPFGRDILERSLPKLQKKT
jgi:hydroxyacylglutathione hydrolase